MDLVDIQLPGAGLSAATDLLTRRAPDVIDLTEPPCDDDGLSPVRGMVAGIALSVPVWAGLGALAWRLRH